MTAREFLEWALEDYDMEEALYCLGQYLGKGGSYFVSFPDAAVLGEDGNPLSEDSDEPADFQEYWQNHLNSEAAVKKFWEEAAGPGRPALSPEEKRKPHAYPLDAIMEALGLSNRDLLMVDDLKLGLDMAKSRSVDFAWAGWSDTAFVTRDFMKQNATYSFDAPSALEEFLMR